MEQSEYETLYVQLWPEGDALGRPHVSDALDNPVTTNLTDIQLAAVDIIRNGIARAAWVRNIIVNVLRAEGLLEAAAT